MRVALIPLAVAHLSAVTPVLGQKEALRAAVDKASNMIQVVLQRKARALTLTKAKEVRKSGTMSVMESPQSLVGLALAKVPAVLSKLPPEDLSDADWAGGIVYAATISAAEGKATPPDNAPLGGMWESTGTQTTLGGNTIGIEDGSTYRNQVADDSYDASYKEDTRTRLGMGCFAEYVGSDGETYVGCVNGGRRRRYGYNTMYLKSQTPTMKDRVRFVLAVRKTCSLAVQIEMFGRQGPINGGQIQDFSSKYVSRRRSAEEPDYWDNSFFMHIKRIENGQTACVGANECDALSTEDEDSVCYRAQATGGFTPPRSPSVGCDVTDMSKALGESDTAYPFRKELETGKYEVIITPRDDGAYFRNLRILPSDAPMDMTGVTTRCTDNEVRFQLDAFSQFD
ncbi:unnamed protein product [Amoebophrya sp. A120]|nr:unnamed protein product [Amoebophrya sp. A120]|eukprot:GSA120T00010950001.1